ncbi:hypothetical protein, partial [Pseudomonas sp. 10-1B]|uniref:hypothetical protein n=1 Tax=Pseudomonas sp. 10-1B TaxID=1546029 RepID=UPI001F195AD8
MTWNIEDKEQRRNTARKTAYGSVTFAQPAKSSGFMLSHAGYCLLLSNKQWMTIWNSPKKQDRVPNPDLARPLWGVIEASNRHRRTFFAGLPAPT